HFGYPPPAHRGPKPERCSRLAAQTRSTTPDQRTGQGIPAYDAILIMFVLSRLQHYPSCCSLQTGECTGHCAEYAEKQSGDDGCQDPFVRFAAIIAFGDELP